MFNTYKEKKSYEKYMECLKLRNIEYKKLITGRYYQTGKIFNVVQGLFSWKKHTDSMKYIKNWIQLRHCDIHFPIKEIKHKMPKNSNYFSSERIAIYTCIFGTYDRPEEPVWKPDNCDYYIITDQEVERTSAWKKVAIEKFINKIDKLTLAEKNRFFKMHPDIIFPEYRYSIYLDGNIQPVTDLTEYIYYISNIGISAHLHSIRNCVYKEAEIVKLLKKEKTERIQNHIEYIRKTKMPEEYGLIECNIIAREHHNPICKKIMDDWWNEFMNYSKRDQISFAHVLYMNGIPVDKVGTMGNNVFMNPSFIKKRHL